MKRQKVTVIYKNGIKVHIKCTDFEVLKYTNGSTEATWKDASPKPLWLNMDQITAIFEGKV